jgi:putative membrane protein
VTDGPRPAEDAAAADATRRTRLANERTELAWWRTGLTALAVAVAVSRIVPELADAGHRWPYVIAGVCFAVYGIAVIAYGSLRRRAVDRSLAEGRFPEPIGAAQGALAIGGVILGLITVVLVLLD